MFTVSATGVATAAPESPNEGIESPLSGVESQYDADNNGNSSIQTASSVGTTAENYGDIPPNVHLIFGSSEEDTGINEIIPTNDGNYIVVASISNSTTSVGAVAKFSPNPNVSVFWSGRYGNNNQQQALWSGIQTQSGDYVLSGWTETTDAQNGWTIKIDEDGNKQWEYVSDPIASSQGVFYDVEETTQGEYLVAGKYNLSGEYTNAQLVTVTSDGELLGRTSPSNVERENDQELFGIEQIEPDRYVAVGRVYQNDNWDAWTIEIDSGRTEYTNRTYFTSAGSDSKFRDVAVTDDNIPIYVGNRFGLDGDSNRGYTSLDAWIYYDSPTNQWDQGISVENINRFSAVDTTNDRVVAVGHTSQNDGVRRSRVTVEYDLDGSRNWLETDDDGVEQDADGVLVEGSETFVVGEKKQTTDDDYSGYLWQYDSTGVVELTNVSIDPETVTSGSTSQHTLSFEALQVSADGDPDEFTITIPESVTLEQVNDVTVESPLYDANETVNGNEITFEVNPNETAEIVDLSITADIELSTGTTDPRGPTEGTEWDVTITRIIDGDTVEAEFPNGEIDTIRLLGVDTPETSFNSVSPSEFEGITDTRAGRDHLFSWGNNATDYAEQRLSGQEVRVVVDEQADRRGSFGRLLAYIYVDGQNFNKQLLTDGYARLYESDFSKRSAFEAAEQTAQDSDVGLWNFDNDMGDQPSSDIVVNSIHEDAEGNDNENLNDEYIVFTNAGSSEVDMSGWSISDEADHTYTIPSGFTLDSGEDMILYTGSGTNEGTVLYWGEESAVWNNGGDTITVEDESGTVVLQRQY